MTASQLAERCVMSNAGASAFAGIRASSVQRRQPGGLLIVTASYGTFANARISELTLTTRFGRLPVLQLYRRCLCSNDRK
jgi:hypothetical protein